MSSAKRVKCRVCSDREAGNDGMCDYCRYTKLLASIDRAKLPWFYRLILKVPGARFLENASGVFWALIVPLFLFMNMLASLFILVNLPFPSNILVSAITPIAALLIFVKLSLDRFISFWNSTISKSYFEWNIDRTIEEYISILKRKERKE